MNAESILGPSGDRVRTEVRLSRKIREITDIYVETFDLPINAVVTLALAQFHVQMSPVIAHGGKRKSVIAAMEKEFLRIVKEVKDRS